MNFILKWRLKTSFKVNRFDKIETKLYGFNIWNVKVKYVNVS